MSKIIIDLRTYASENELQMTEVTNDFNIHIQTLYRWQKEAPDVIKGIFKAMQEQPDTDILKILKGWQNPPFAVAFIRAFMLKHNCNFNEIVTEIN